MQFYQIKCESEFKFSKNHPELRDAFKHDLDK